jgi:Cu(I)/Ag(I) efflux system periplasmic protein CusF
MKKVVLVLAVALSTAAGVRAAETGGTKVEEAKTQQAGANAAVNRTTGVVKGLDATMGTVTLAHEPVPALKWPAMVMPFKISPNLAKGLQVGQKVDVEFESQGMSATITRIAIAK